MTVVSNFMGGFGLVFGLTFMIAISDVIVSYVNRDGKTLSEIVTERVGA